MPTCFGSTTASLDDITTLQQFSSSLLKVNLHFHSAGESSISVKLALMLLRSPLMSLDLHDSDSPRRSLL